MDIGRGIKSTYCRHGGFTLIELLVVMAISLFVLAAASQVLIGMTTQFKQQSRIAQSGIDSGFALETLRKDISMAGYGLPTGLQNGASTEYNITDWSILGGNYLEVDEGNSPIGYQFNDGAPHYQPPRMVLAGVSNDPANLTFNGSDYLVIKSANAGVDPSAGKFEILYKEPDINGALSDKLTPWQRGGQALDETVKDFWRDPKIQEGTWVIVLTTRDDENLGLVRFNRDPVTNVYSPKMDRDADDGYFGLFGYLPTDPQDMSIVYGICTELEPWDFCPAGSITTLRAPFNRVDYYISDDDKNKKCAPGTGSLYRAEMSHTDGGMGRRFKLMDCVADMQVVFELAADPETGIIDGPTDNINDLSAKQIKKSLEEVQVYVLMHEGQFDRNYEHKTAQVEVAPPGNAVLGNTFDLEAIVGRHWDHYRWRVVKVGERPVGKGANVE